MSRANPTVNDPEISGALGLPGFGRQPLTPQQQIDALKRVQSQAEQRVKLGMQLFKAAEARISHQQDVLGQVKTLQEQLREQVNQDVAKSLHSYDQWLGRIDESFTTAIRKLNEKVDALQADMTQNESRIQNMLARAETLLDQSRCMIEQPPQTRSTPTPTPAPAKQDQADPHQTDLPASTKPPQAVRPDAAESSQKPMTKQPPLQAGPHTVQENTAHEGDEKIYLTLLDRLIHDHPDGKKSADQSDAA